jgi:phage terminase large subunit-like protein
MQLQPAYQAYQRKRETAIENDALIACGRDSLLSYTQIFRPEYRVGLIHQEIAEALEAVEQGQITRLMLWEPPRHGKSMLCSEHFPPWFLGRNPSGSIICASYGQDLADDFGRRVRNQMVDPLYNRVFPECTVAYDSASVSRISTEQFGNYYAVGIGSGVVGRGANVLLVDDPVKDREAADSVIVRKNVKNWYQSAAYQRLMPGGAIVIMQTRWHEDDLSGWLLREHASEGWVIIKRAVEPDGKIMVAPWPEQFSIEDLKRIKKAIGAREWQAQYNQTPTLEGGGVFMRSMMRYYSGTPLSAARGTNRYILVDPAGEDRPGNDYTTMWVIGLGQDNNARVLDIVRDRIELPDRAKTLMRLHRKWRPLQTRYERVGMQGDVQHLKEVQKRENYFFDVTEVGNSGANAKVHKHDRIKRLLPMFNEGRFWFPETFYYTPNTDASATVDLIQVFINEEFQAFPVAIHDDMLDSLARLVEPDLPLVWPQPEEQVDPDRSEDYMTTLAEQSEGGWMR